MRARRLGLTRLASWGFTALAAAAWLGLFALFVAQSGGLGRLAGTEWFYRAGRFGALPMLYGTLAVSAVALLVAVPVGVGAAVFSAEILTGRARLLVKTTVELLAAVPSVVYGLLGVVLLRGWVYRLLAAWEPLSGDTLLTGGLLLGVMILPTVMTFSDDALMAVPARQKAAARALGLTRAEVVFGVGLRQALPGLLSAVLLALGRALGETVAVFLVVGRQDNQWPERLLALTPLTEAGQTLTSKLGGSETFLAIGDPAHWSALMGLALVLLLVVAGVSVAGAFLATAGGRDA